ncbi:MAG: type II toxin-antitoxin system HicB family antitoxin, partial [Lachnospiraceae bacterium]|nr:type II toxin-antitoxin system HicB family antitoxin [Lachnospiraceae bacterium]
MRFTIRIPDDLHSDITALAKESGASLNYIVEQALKYYRDKRYMEDKATIINEEMLSIIKANNALLEQQINNKANRVLSELAIQSAIQNLI